MEERVALTMLRPVACMALDRAEATGEIYEGSSRDIPFWPDKLASLPH